MKEVKRILFKNNRYSKKSILPEYLVLNLNKYVQHTMQEVLEQIPLYRLPAGGEFWELWLPKEYGALLSFHKDKNCIILDIEKERLEDVIIECTFNDKKREIPLPYFIYALKKNAKESGDIKKLYEIDSFGEKMTIALLDYREKEIQLQINYN